MDNSDRRVDNLEAPLYRMTIFLGMTTTLMIASTVPIARLIYHPEVLTLDSSSALAAGDNRETEGE